MILLFAQQLNGFNLLLKLTRIEIKVQDFKMWPSKYNQPELCLFRTVILATWLQAAGIRLHSAYFTA